MNTKLAIALASLNNSLQAHREAVKTQAAAIKATERIQF